MALDSVKTFQNQLPKSQVINLPIYKTSPKENIKIELKDIYIFTSPSNVEAYFSCNTYKENATYVAMGICTGKKLEEFQVNTYHIPDEMSYLGLARLTLKLSGQ
jgi:hydroxymethylbilane synthase